MWKLLSFLLFLVVQNEILAWRIFHNGRIVGGNLGIPKSEHRRKTDVTAQEEVPEKWYLQTLDHFDTTNEKRWKQRYFIDTTFAQNRKPNRVFLLLGGEGEASVKWMSQGSWVDYGKQFGAILIQLEHRYYGRSQPTEDLSTENMKYLSSEQALADAAEFIEFINEVEKFDSDVKWIAFGGSYSGSLAAWLRLKYPHLVHGAMSASGPLLAVADFQDYFTVVSESLRATNDGCVTAVQQGFKQMDTLLTQPIGQKNLNKIFNLCDPIDEFIGNQMDVSNFFNTIADNFAGVVQYNKDNRIGHPKGYNITIDMVCNIMTDQSLGTPVNRLGKVNDMLLQAYDLKCTDYRYEKMLEIMRNTSWNAESSEGGRQWMFQTCHEFGFFQTSTNPGHIYGNRFPVEFFEKQCRDLFGMVSLNEVIAETNMIYGALGIDVTNVVFVHGSIDPWHALGITQSQKPGAPAIYIKGTAHCANMYPPSPKDSFQLKAARKQVRDLIGSWLKQ